MAEPAPTSAAWLLIGIVGFFLILWLAAAQVLAMELVLSQVPAEIEAAEEFRVHFSYQTTVENQAYYLRPCFHFPDKTSYFGCIRNSQGDWVCGSQPDKTSYLEIQTDDQGEWQGDLVIKAGGGNGGYQLKVGRYTAGGSVKYSNSVKIKINSSPSSSSFLSPTPSSASVPSSAPSPSSASVPPPALYIINQPKDKAGEKVNSVKVYVDGVYLHHYAPEELEFCQGCSCDGQVDCGFGRHKISLKRSGYEEWSEEKEINSGNSFTVDPLMVKVVEGDNGTEAVGSSLPSPSLTALVIAQTGEEEEKTVMNEEAKEADKEESLEFQELVLGEEEKKEDQEKRELEEKKERKKGFSPGWPLLISLSGIFFLSAAVLPLAKPEIAGFFKRIAGFFKRIKRLINQLS